MSILPSQDTYAGSGNPAAAAPAFAAPPLPGPFPGAFPVVPAPDGRHVLQMVQHLSTRVQKLERSKGQISKDLSEMLREAQDLNKRLDSEKSGGVREAPLARAISLPVVAATSAVASPHEQAVDDKVQAGATDAGLRPGLSPPTTSAASIEPPPGLDTDVPQRSKMHPPLHQTLSRRTDGPPMPLPESLQVQEKSVNGETVYTVKWRIDNVKSKFKDCIGRPLVSPQFEAGELAELRLMVFPNIGIDASSTMRDQKSKFEAVIAEGPLKGALKFKVVGGQGVAEGECLLIDFSLFVGAMNSGPMSHNFAEHIIKGYDFNSDWLQEIDRGALTVGVEISKVDPLIVVEDTP